MGKTTTLHVHLTFLYISLPFLHDYDVNCLILLFLEDVNRPRRNVILFVNLNMVLTNSTPAGFAYIWRSKWVGIIAIKTERTQIHFWSDVSLPSRRPIVKSLMSSLEQANEMAPVSDAVWLCQVLWEATVLHVALHVRCVLSFGACTRQ